MEYIRLHRRGIIVSVGIVIVMAILLSILYSIFFLHIRSVDPNPGRMSYLTRTIRLEFNRTVESVESVELNGSLSYTINDSVVVVDVPLETFEPGNDYELVVVNAKSDLGQTVARQVVTLSPRTGDDLLSEEDRDKILNDQQELKNDSVNNPIFSYLPYETLDYSIVGVVSNANNEFEAIAIEITVYLSSADSSDRTGAIARYEAAARAYLSGLEGVNIDDYPITVKVVDLS